MRVLTVSGSLRKISTNTALLQALARLAPPSMEVKLFEGLAGLPYFNPDLEAEPPAATRAFLKEVREADAIVLSSPEYARGVPGVLKNALDWLVGGTEIVGKPVAVISASPRAEHAREQLKQTLRTISAKVVEAACITVPLLGTRLSDEEIADSLEYSQLLRDALEALRQAAAA